jgi:hypothetical protein
MGYKLILKETNTTRLTWPERSELPLSIERFKDDERAALSRAFQSAWLNGLVAGSAGDRAQLDSWIRDIRTQGWTGKTASHVASMGFAMGEALAGADVDLCTPLSELDKVELIDEENQGMSGNCHSISNFWLTDFHYETPKVRRDQLCRTNCCKITETLNLCQRRQRMELPSLQFGSSMAAAALRERCSVAHVLFVEIFEFILSPVSCDCFEAAQADRIECAVRIAPMGEERSRLVCHARASVLLNNCLIRNRTRTLDFIHSVQVALCMDYFLFEAKSLTNLDKVLSRLAASSLSFRL